MHGVYSVDIRRDTYRVHSVRARTCMHTRIHTRARERDTEIRNTRGRIHGLLRDPGSEATDYFP